MLTNEQVNTGFNQLLETLLWSSCDIDTGEPLDNNYSIHDIDMNSELLVKLWNQYNTFINDNHDLICEYIDTLDADYTDIGHNYWLTLNGHGAGFWDRGAGNVGDELTKVCKGCEFTPYVNDDNKIDLM